MKATQKKEITTGEFYVDSLKDEQFEGSKFDSTEYGVFYTNDDQYGQSGHCYFYGDKDDCIKDAEARNQHIKSSLNLQNQNRMEIKHSELETKILQAKELGIKFNLVPPGQGQKEVPYDTMNVLQTYSDNDFEKDLDRIIENVKNRKYLKILRNHKLID